MTTKVSTKLGHLGRCRDLQPSFVNPPVWRGSTVLFPSLRSLLSKDQDYNYGRHGTPTTRALESLLKELDGPLAHGVHLTPSGLSAVTTAVLSVMRPNDHLLVVDSVYQPMRAFCDTVLARMGVEVTYFDPRLSSGIRNLLRPQTKAVYLETPGSQTFEMQDVQAIAEEAHRVGAFVIADNTWATPLFFRPLEHGVDIAIQAATKYIVGHSDALMGVIAANSRAWTAVHDMHSALGLSVSPDDAYLALRGLRTLELRLKQHERNALTVADWLEKQPAVAQVLHPGLPSHPDHALWRRDFSGSSGVFGVVLRPSPFPCAEALFDGLQLFGMGFSFGGYESLATYVTTEGLRTATPWSDKGHLIRLQIGLEDPEDLIADLSAGLERFEAARECAA